jgi:hypothetical protein
MIVALSYSRAPATALLIELLVAVSLSLLAKNDLDTIDRNLLRRLWRSERSLLAPTIARPRYTLLNQRNISASSERSWSLKSLLLHILDLFRLR